jgi:hypothetical protein
LAAGFVVDFDFAVDFAMNHPFRRAGVSGPLSQAQRRGQSRLWQCPKPATTPWRRQEFVVTVRRGSICESSTEA